MSKSMRNGLGIAAIALLLTGCGPSPEEELVKEQVALVEKMASLYEKVTDKDSLKAADKESTALGKRVTQINAELEVLPAEKKDAARAAQKTNLEAAYNKLGIARDSAKRIAHPELFK